MQNKFILSLLTLTGLLTITSPGLATEYVRSYFDTASPPSAPLNGGVSSSGNSSGNSNGLYSNGYSSGLYSSSGALQGGVKNEAVIRPAVRLTPQYYGQAQSGGGAGLIPNRDEFMPVQYKGSVRISPPDLSGAVNSSALGSQSPQYDRPGGYPSNYPGSYPGGLSGAIPPISSYVRTPANGVINYGAAPSFMPVSVGSSSYVYNFNQRDSRHSQNQVSRSQIFSNNFLQNLPRSPGEPELPHYIPVHFPTTGTGITVLDPSLAVTEAARLPDDPPSVQMVGPGFNNSMISSTTSNHLTNSSFQETHYITRGGITTAPGYEVTITPPGLAKETLGGHWAAGVTPIGITAIPGTLSPEKMFVKEAPVASTARAQVLPALRSSQTCASWKDWYSTVARAIYSRWTNIEVCPGTAKLQVTVRADHDISAQVVNFTPAVDIERNIPRETDFRESAVNVVNSVGFFEIPDFPATKVDQVVFDIDLKRTVDGPGGVSVAGYPNK